MKQFTIIKPGTRINFTGVRRRFLYLSLTLILASITILVVNLFVRGSMLNWGIDFRGGTQIQIEFQKKPGLNTGAIRRAMTKLKYSRLSVIKAGTEGNAYVIRMENPGSMDPRKKKRLHKVLKKRLRRSIVTMTLPAKGAVKASDVAAECKRQGAKDAIVTPPVPGTAKPTLRLVVKPELGPKTTQKLKAELEKKFAKTKVSVEGLQILRRFKPTKSGDTVRLVFSEPAREQDIRDIFGEAKIDLALSAGAVARRGRQARNKIKWQVHLLGLSDLLTKQLNKDLSRFVKGTGTQQNLRFELNLAPDDNKVRLALGKAGYQKNQPYSLRATFTHKEMRKPSDVRQEILTAGLILRTGSVVARVGDASMRRWRADLAFKKYTPVKTIHEAFNKFGALDRLSIRITEERFRQAITAAGYGPEDAITLRVVFKLNRAVNSKELKKELKDAKLPIAKHRDIIAQVGEAQEHKWLVVLDVLGKQSGMSIERRLAKAGAVGITAIDVPPHGAVKAIQSVVRVGSKVGKKLRIDGILSVLYTLAFILVYIGLRFDLKFAPGAVIALAHDVTITVGIWAVLWLEFNLASIAALLTIVGYSLNDTIVVYDRIRENLTRLRDVNLEKVVNTSLNETLSRTILTSITTLFSIVAILFLASGDLWIFALALFIGVLIGTYSSLYVASPVVLWLDAYLSRRAETTKSTGGGDRGDGSGRSKRQYQKREKKSKGDARLKDAEAES